MLIEKLYLGLILLFFILAFAIKNITTYFAEKTSIRGRSAKLTASITLSTVIYVLIALRLFLVDPATYWEFDLSKYGFIKVVGYILVSTGFVIGLLSLITMKNSWRVGIKYEQKTALITSGIYRLSRNPYFLSYDLLILGYILIFPSLLLILLYVPLVIIFHYMILEEEKYLLTMHKEDYASYKQRVNRYFTLKFTS